MAPNTTKTKSKEIPDNSDLMEILMAFREDFTSFKREIHDDIKDLKNLYKETTSNIKALDIKHDNLEKKVAKLHSDNEKLSSQLLKFTKESKARNMIIYKLDDSENFNKDLFTNTLEYLKKFDKSLNANHIDVIRRLGRKPSNRPVLIRFNSFNIKSTLFSKIIKAENCSISVANDLTAEELCVRDQLKSLVKKLAAVDIVAKIKSSKVVVDSKFYTMEQAMKTFGSAMSKDSAHVATDIPSNKAAMTIAEAPSDDIFSTPTTAKSPSANKTRGRPSKIPTSTQPMKKFLEKRATRN